MTAGERMRGYLGLAARAGKVESGEFSTEKAVKSGRAHLVVIADDASENTKKKFMNMCEYYEVPCFVFAELETLGHTIGRQFRASLAVTDIKLAKELLVLEKQENQKQG